MMMRHLFVNAIQESSQVPVFVELRELNNSDVSLFELIIRKLIDSDFDFGVDYIRKALEAGHFSLLLDGFDEVALEKREELIKSIQELVDKYPKNNIILSSRPDDSLFKWELFNVWRVEPLMPDLAIELIEKTETDAEIKAKFINALKNGLFEKHESFLSNPLLLSIMLITYENSGNIPHKISTFYDRAYTALFEQHDARKAFHRVKRTDLDISDFRKVFSVFCFLSYLKNAYNFSDTELFEYLKKARSIAGIDFNIQDFIHDATQAICLLIREGLDITFSHRSFQEYFATLYNSQLADEKVKEAFVLKQANSFSDESINLSQEVSAETIEKSFIIPQINKLEEIIGYTGTYNEEQHLEVLQTLYSTIKTTSTSDYEAFGEDDPDWSVVVKVNDRILNTAINLLSNKYLKVPCEHIGEGSNLFQIVSQLEQQAGGAEVSLSSVLKNTEFYEAIISGKHWLSFNYFSDIFEAKKDLVQKHKERESLLLDETLKNLPPEN